MISHRDAQIRVEELERYEVAHGFVYAGEKKWLTSTCFHEGGRYSDWIVMTLDSEVFPDAGLTWEENDGTVRLTGYTDDVTSLLLFREFAEQSVLVNYLDIIIHEGQIPINPEKAAHFFEILHNLSYYLNIAGQRFFPSIYLDQIVLQNELGDWSMEFQNEYGSVGDMFFSYSDPVPSGS